MADQARLPLGMMPTTLGASRAPVSSKQTASGAEAYRFDPSLRIEEQSGLDRLRCIEDRELAHILYSIYVLREEGQARAVSARPSNAKASRTIGIRVLATRALSGELGFVAQELATNLLVDESGRENFTERTLQDFARAFRKLPRAR